VVGRGGEAIVALRAAGEAAKVALTARMRKLLTTLNAMVKHKTPWAPQEVLSTNI
jgi:hypothetical protein